MSASDGCGSREGEGLDGKTYANNILSIAFFKIMFRRPVAREVGDRGQV